VRKLTADFLQRLLIGTLPRGCADTITLLSATRVEDGAMWAACGRRQVALSKKWQLAAGERCLPPHHVEGNAAAGARQVLTSAMLLGCETAESALSLENISTHLNEFFLWHGTSKASAYAIVKTGFCIKEDSTSTRFGQGAYFAEDVRKSLSYAEEAEGKRYLLLCRVTCGQMHYTEQGLDPNATLAARAAGMDSTLACPIEGGCREFVVFDTSQVYPEYILEVDWRCGA